MKKIFFVFLLCWMSTLHAEPFLLAAGAGYKRPVTDLTRAYEASTGNRIDVFFGNMAQVSAQIKQSGKVAMILADQDFLQKFRGIDIAKTIVLGDGKLVLAYAKGKTLKQAQELSDPAWRRVAMPEPANATYGKAAQEFLVKSGLERQIRDKLMKVSTVPQVSAYLISGDVDAGFINLTDALGIRKQIGGYIEIDPASYSRIHITAAILKGWEGNAGVHAFATYLQSPSAHAILAMHGLQ
ncbi:molybdate ABC transporter substrate-binding protein [Pectobacteriaceae bacterium CE90]|nr:molybdate ABC transporter substrate-binding protein [Prodigiosinella sp. LS101]WJV53245.1 molybdate ABC transporter substrate-binding protein [Prodigiosinella sp. LS101]WJV57606.1 molybdate ABC transporter substrate-binding protein [Pectobacteriaceae bacterium C111]WJY15744.1 molybdate ABC transporter substrate-binding protein [Pectobacteriaceae bacterium CE90]